MKTIVYNALLLVTVLSLHSCIRKETPADPRPSNGNPVTPGNPHEPGSLVVGRADMDATYKYQVYYNLTNNTIVSKNIKSSWDIAFEATADGYRVILNASKLMSAAFTGKTDFAALTDTVGYGAHVRYDNPSGNLDSTAIGDWRNSNNVYIIDRGMDETGFRLGFEKVQIQSVSNEKYVVRIAKVNGTAEATIDIPKDNVYNFTFLSFENNTVVQVEPPKATWDLVFTQYTHIFYDPFTPYLVTGCLLNRYSTYAALDSVRKFDDINFDNAKEYSLTQDINIIGYDWKKLDNITSAKYTVDPNKVYIIKDAAGIYYKLHFVDFYSSAGVKGNPAWECQRL